MPTTQSTFRPELGVLAYEFSLDASRQGFIGLQVLPVFETDRQSAEYPVIPARAMLEMQDTARAPRSMRKTVFSPPSASACAQSMPPAPPPTTAMIFPFMRLLYRIFIQKSKISAKKIFLPIDLCAFLY